MPETEDESSGTWEASAGQVGAPAPPPWSIPPSPHASDPAPDEPTPDGERPHSDDRFPPHRDVYGVQSFGHDGDGYAAQSLRRRRGAAPRYGRLASSYATGSRPYLRASGQQQRAARLGRPHAISIALLVVGAVTVGLAYPVFALGALAAAFRARRFTQSMRVPPARTWLVYAIVFAVLGVTSITLLGVLGSQTSSTDVPPLVSKTVPLGQPATVLADVTDLTNRYVPVTVTVISVAPFTAPHLQDNTAVSLRICAGPQAVDPGLVTAELYLEPTVGNPITSEEVSADLIASTVASGRCLSGSAYYNVPAGTTLKAATYGIVQTVTWPLAPAASG